MTQEKKDLYPNLEEFPLIKNSPGGMSQSELNAFLESLEQVGHARKDFREEDPPQGSTE